MPLTVILCDEDADRLHAICEEMGITEIEFLIQVIDSEARRIGLPGSDEPQEVISVSGRQPGSQASRDLTCGFPD